MKEEIIKIKLWFIKDKNIIIVAILIGFLIALISALYTRAYSNNIQKKISDQVIRFHILANSNSEIDQNLKIKVRDAVLKEYHDILETSSNIDETKKILNLALDDIKSIAKNIVLEEGFDYDIKVLIENSMFPTKEYGNIKLPIGEYNALKIVIGNGEGHNWWCVLFPPLCFVDISKGVISNDMKKKLKDILSEEEYKLIANSSDNLIDIKFKIIEFWKKKYMSNKNKV